MSNGFSLGAEYIPAALPGAAAAPPLSSSWLASQAMLLHWAHDQAFLMLPLLPRRVFTVCLLLINPTVFPDFQASELLELWLSGITFVSCLPLSEHQLSGVGDFVLFMLEEK